eukprot:TRINITY_DN3062_c0_g1_i1.p1 TRINITY_DN3062_c0_g1~~TRINITY_DN3062_c0_g1_i1.p1  ORF type:complete len:754 (+),score=209.48 TRINITY_DN3062_c0_g1_i1:33-2294(+)
MSKQPIGTGSNFDNASLWESAWEKEKEHITSSPSRNDLESEKPKNVWIPSSKPNATVPSSLITNGSTTSLNSTSSSSSTSSLSPSSSQTNLFQKKKSKFFKLIKTTSKEDASYHKDELGDSIEDEDYDAGAARFRTVGRNSTVRHMEKGVYWWKSFDRIGMGSTIAPEYVGKLIIAEPSASFCEALYEFFFDVNQTKIVNKSFNQLDNTPFDAFIFPSNAFGFREQNKIWKDVEQFFGEKLITQIRQHIKLNYMGEAPLFASFLIETGHPVVKWLVYTVSHLSSLVNESSYSVLWSALVAIRNHNRDAKPENRIEKFVSKGIWSATKGDEESARQMFLAYHNLLAPPSEASEGYLDAKDSTLSRVEKIEPEERIVFLTDHLLSGDLEKRDFITHETMNFLISLFLKERSPEETEQDHLKLLKSAARAITYYTFPIEYVTGLADVVINRGMLHPLLELVVRGEIQPHLEIDMNEVKYDPTPIAEGGSGRVFRGHWRGNEVAIKEFSDSMLNFSIVEFKREVAILSMLRHENLVPFYGAAMNNPNCLYVITKFMVGGNLREYLKSSIEIPYATRLRIATDIAKGMAFLHSKGIIHRDLKSLNVMIDNGSAKIIDFGASRAVDTDNTMTSTIGTVSWMAPEVFTGEKYTEKADVYSFGIVLWELATRKIPFNELSSYQIPVLVAKGERPTIPKECNAELAKLIKASWHQKPKQRPAFHELHVELAKLYAQENPDPVSSRPNSSIGETAPSTRKLKS